MESKEFRLSDVVNIISGGTPRRKIKSYWDGDIPWLSIKDFNNKGRKVYETEESITEEGLSNSSTNLVKPGTVIVSARGTADIPSNCEAGCKIIAGCESK